MLLVTKKGLQIGTNVKDFASVGIKISYLFFETNAVNLVARVGGVSKAEARRKIKEGGVWLGNERQIDPNEIILPRDKGCNSGMTLFIGKEFKGIII